MKYQRFTDITSFSPGLLTTLPVFRKMCRVEVWMTFFVTKSCICWAISLPGDGHAPISTNSGWDLIFRPGWLNLKSSSQTFCLSTFFFRSWGLWWDLAIVCLKTLRNLRASNASAIIVALSILFLSPNEIVVLWIYLSLIPNSWDWEFRCIYSDLHLASWWGMKPYGFKPCSTPSFFIRKLIPGDVSPWYWLGQKPFWRPGKGDIWIVTLGLPPSWSRWRSWNPKMERFIVGWILSHLPALPPSSIWLKWSQHIQEAENRRESKGDNSWKFWFTRTSSPASSWKPQIFHSKDCGFSSVEWFTMWVNG